MRCRGNVPPATSVYARSWLLWLGRRFVTPQLGLATPARRKESARNWRTMQNALKSGNVEAAAEAVEKLIEDSRREAVKQLEARQAAANPRVRNA